MLSPAYRYLAFDFETTGLDTKKDEAIQIGIVEFDHTFQIIDTYSSLIKPNKDIKQLKSIVSHLTWFALTDLENAPSIEQVLPEMQRFFGPDTVIVWHNISFDLAILNKYMSREPAHSIDTYTLSRALLHYVPSYALDVINQHLQKTNDHREGEVDDAHDALHDSYMWYNLFRVLMTKITQLRHKYLILDYMIQRWSGTLHAIISRTQKPYTFEDKELFFPPLSSRQTGSQKKIIRDTPLSFGSYDQHQELDISLSSIQELITYTDWSQWQRVITCTHKSKVDIIAKAFKKINVEVGTLHDQVQFDPERVDRFLHQLQLTDAEILFGCKYFSQYDANHTILDINSQDEYKIFDTLSNQTKNESKKITLCTHQQLFQIKHKIRAQHTVLFMDKDRWAQSYGKIVRQRFDPLYLLNHLDQIEYKYKLIEHPHHHLIQEFHRKTVFLHSALSMEINPMFRWSNIQKVECIDLAHDTRCPKSVALIPLWTALREQTNPTLLPEDLWLTTKVEQLIKYLHWQTTITKKMYNGDSRYYQFQDTHTYVDRQDFAADLPPAGKTLFLSNQKKSPNQHRIAHRHSTDTVQPLRFLNIQTITKIPNLISTITQSGKSCFVVSSDKSRSKMLFDQLVKQGTNSAYEVLWENITWWVGKNIYRASTTKKPVILIWWYNFYFAALAKEIGFDTAYLHHLHGKLAPMIVNDLAWWWS